MKMTCEAMPDTIAVGGIHVQGVDWDGFNISHIRFPAGADAEPLLQGLPGNLCQCPHWGMVLKGRIHVRYGDGRSETVNAGEVYHWPAGHTVSVDQDYESIEFSPATEMAQVMDHLKTRLGV